jgi:hypothetical protein
MMKPPKRQLTVRRALTDRSLLGGVLGGDSWRTWRTLLIAAMGEALNDDERAIFRQLTGASTSLACVSKSSSPWSAAVVASPARSQRWPAISPAYAITAACWCQGNAHWRFVAHLISDKPMSFSIIV